MEIKTTVTPEEKCRIKGMAKAEGKSVSAYLRDRALGKPEMTNPLMEFIETQAEIAQRVNEIVTTTLKNKVVYEAEILELLDRMTALEETTAAALKGVSKHGYSRK